MPTRSKTPARRAPAKTPATTRSLVRPAAPPPSAPRSVTLTAPPPSAPRATKPSAPPPPPAKQAAKAAKADKAARTPKKAPLALVRDGFTMPAADFALIAQLKSRALEGQRAAKKSELLRAGLHALVALDQAALVAALDRLEPVKTGRPKKGG